MEEGQPGEVDYQDQAQILEDIVGRELVILEAS